MSAELKSLKTLKTIFGAVTDSNNTRFGIQSLLSNQLSIKEEENEEDEMEALGMMPTKKKQHQIRSREVLDESLNTNQLQVEFEAMEEHKKELIEDVMDCLPHLKKDLLKLLTECNTLPGSERLLKA